MKGKADRGELPVDLAPELATLVSAPPASAEDWIFEVKFDGYRMLARIDRDDVRLISRNAKDWTAKLLPLQKELRRMSLPAGWYDGEIIVHDASGRPDFGLLQNSFDRSRASDIVYFLFDAPFIDGHDQRDRPLVERRDALQRLLAERRSDQVRFSDALEAAPGDMLAAACQMGLEGLIGKRKTSPYVGSRSNDWIKLKCGLRQEFVIGGYTDAGGARAGFGALLLGTYDKKGKLVYAGSVGTGFNEKTLRDIYKQLQIRASDKSPFSPSRDLTKKGRWVRPDLVAEVAFAEWTHTGSIRHASFRGMRKDKKASSITREHAAAVGVGAVRSVKTQDDASSSATAIPTFKITHGERIVDPQSGTTKEQLIAYYASVSQLMLVHLVGRPVSLVRAPAGIGGELFFQKHAETAKLAGVRRFPVEIHPGHPPMLEVASAQALLSTAQWNVVEYHTQNALGDRYATPNRMIFDLDPGEGVSWGEIQEAAQLVRAMLEHLGLPSFLKTSGGKGLHLDVPIVPMYGWDLVKTMSKAIVVHMAGILPARFAAKSGAANRKNKIFIDYLRNGRGATTACAWSARARPGLGISVPVGWDELQGLSGGDNWAVATAHDRLAIGNTPWLGYDAAATSINEALDMLELKRPRSH